MPAYSRPRPLRARALSLLTSVVALTSLSTPAHAAPTRPQFNITAYTITADLDPATNHLAATAAVTFTTLEDLPAVTFELNSGLLVTAVTDATKKPLTSDRTGAIATTLHVTPPQPLAKGTTSTWTFTYAGALVGTETSPVEGIKLAAVADPISLLLYPGRWFPMTGLFTDRFTAEMHIRVPADMRVVGSGSGVAATKSLPGNRSEYTFLWTRPGFPGTIVAGKFLDPIAAPGINNIHVYVLEKHKPSAVAFAQNAAKTFEFMTTTFGQPESPRINIVELPDDGGISAAWAPETRRHRRVAHRRSQKRHPPARQHHRPPVVGFGSLPGDPQRRLDHQRHEPLRRADGR